MILNRLLLPGGLIWKVFAISESLERRARGRDLKIEEGFLYCKKRGFT
jgi:hypothetical protein